MDVPSGDKYSIAIITSIYKRIDFKGFTLATRVVVAELEMKETRKQAGMSKRRGNKEKRGEDGINVNQRE